MDDKAGIEANLDWNVLVTSREGELRSLRRMLAPLARLRGTGFRNVLTARVDDLTAFLTGVAELRERQILQEHQLGRVLPIERTFRVAVDDFDAQLRAETAYLLPRLANRRFHVRLERRGHKGIIDTAASEHALGEHLYHELEARGELAGVDFRDPDVVVVVELVGDVGGIGLITRELHQQFPFVKID
jgi:tRNA(Ser,Leu) C12 N-acetylase TAN1